MPDTTHLNVIDFHTHFPLENTLGLEPPPPPRHPLLTAYAETRAARMRSEWDTAPPEPVAKTPEEVEAALERWAGEVERYDLRRVNFVTGGATNGWRISFYSIPTSSPASRTTRSGPVPARC